MLGSSDQSSAVTRPGDPKYFREYNVGLALSKRSGGGSTGDVPVATGAPSLVHSDKATLIEKHAREQGATHLIAEGPRAGDVVEETQVPPQTRSVPATAENLKAFLDAQSAQDRSEAFQTNPWFNGPRSQDYRLVIRSDGRDHTENTTSSDWTITIPAETDLPPVAGFDIAGYQLPLSRHTIEANESRVPIRFGRHTEPGARAMGLVFSVDDDGNPVPSASSAAVEEVTAVGELPLTHNPIVAMAPVEVGDTRGVRIWTQFRVGSCCAALASHWEQQAADGSTFFSLTALPGVAGSEGTDARPVPASLLVAPTPKTGPYLINGSGMPEEEAPTINAPDAGTSALIDSFSNANSASTSVSHVDDLVLDEGAREIVLVDETLFESLFGGRDVSDCNVLDTRLSRGGLPLGFLSARPSEDLGELCHRFTIATRVSVSPYGIGCRVVCTPHNGWYPEVEVHWPAQDGRDRRRPSIPIIALRFDRLADLHFGFGKLEEVSEASNVHQSANMAVFRSTAPATLSCAETAALEPGPVPSVRALRTVTQMGFEGALFVPISSDMTELLPTFFTVPIQVQRGGNELVSWVQVRAGRYFAPQLLADAVRTALVGAFPSMGFHTNAIFVNDGGVRFAGLSFMADRPFLLRFDLCPPDNPDTDTNAVSPSVLGYETRRYSGRSQYFPPFADRQPTRSRVPPRTRLGSGLLEPWPGRVQVIDPGRTERIVLKTEAYPVIGEASLVRNYAQQHAAIMETPIAHALPTHALVSVYPEAWAENDVITFDGLEALIGSVEKTDVGGTLATLKENVGNSDAEGIIDTVFDCAKAVREEFHARRVTESLATVETNDALLAAFTTLGSEAVAFHALTGSEDDIGEADESTLLDVVQYARMVVLRLLPQYAVVVGRTVPISCKGTETPTEDEVNNEVPDEVPFGFSSGYAALSRCLAHDLSSNPESLADAAFDATETRTLAIVYTSTDFGPEVASPQNATAEASLGIALSQLVVTNATSFRVAAAPPDTMTLDLASKCMNRIQTATFGFMPAEYVCLDDREIASDREPNLHSPTHVEVHVEVNPKSRPSTVDEAEHNHPDEMRPTDVGRDGSIIVVGSTDDARSQTYVTRCSAVVPLDANGIVRGEDRVGQVFGTPVRVGSIRVTVTQPDGTLYPFHGVATAMHLQLTTVDGGGVHV